MKAIEIFENNKIINEWLEESMGEITPEIEALIKELAGNIEDFVGYMIPRIKEKQGLLEAKKNYIRELQESSKTIDNQIQRNIDLVDTVMKIANLDKVQTAQGKVSYRKSEQVIITDSKLIDRKFFVEKIDYKEDKKAIKEAIKSGEEIQGAYLEEKQNIQIGA